MFSVATYVYKGKRAVLSSVLMKVAVIGKNTAMFTGSYC